MKKGLLIIISGPSGVGKGTVVKELMKNNSLNLHYSISMTTRSPRIGETNGKEYFFVTKDEFLSDIKNDNLLEYAEFVSNFYGTPKKYVNEMLEKGNNIILEIETNGARQVMERAKDFNLVTIFLLPPSLYELESRIKNRRTETDEIIKERLEKANKEIQLKNLYKYQVINDIPENAANKIAEIIKNEMIK